MKLILRAASWIAAMGLVAGLLSASASADHPNALWHVVHGLCMRDARLIGRPDPCLSVNLKDGYAVVPDPKGRTQVLLVPTDRIVGIESPRLLAPDGVNYWQAAWEARRFVEKRAGRPVPRDAIGMAINSAYSRSQDQLHIHVDCVKPGVRRVLSARGRRIGTAWAPLRERLGGQRFMARRLSGEDLQDRDPFKLLSRGVPGARGHMARETLVVVGAVFADGSPGFYLLGGDDGKAFGEGLLDHQCAVLSAP